VVSNDPITFFRHPSIARPKARLNMREAYLKFSRCKGRCQGRIRVTDREYVIWLFGAEVTLQHRDHHIETHATSIVSTRFEDLPVL
jgi:hypothetical protein